MKHRFEFEFEQEKKNRMSFEYSPEADERLDVLIEDKTAILALNRAVMITLAKTLIKMALGSYDDGFHVHLRKDLNADLPDRLVVMLHDNESTQADPIVSPEVASEHYLKQ